MVLLVRYHKRRPVPVLTDVVIERIGRAQQYGPFFQVKRNVRFQINRSRKVTSDRENKPAASLVVDMVDGLLNGARVERCSVGPDTEQRSIVIFCDELIAQHSRETENN